jgi:hypothetical protein
MDLKLIKKLRQLSAKLIYSSERSYTEHVEASIAEIESKW